MSGFYRSSALGGSLVMLLLGITSASLSTRPAQAATECDEILTETGPTDQTYLCGKTREVTAPPRSSVVSGKLACDSEIVVEARDTHLVCRNPLATANQQAHVSREPAMPAGMDTNVVGTWEIPLAAGHWVLEVFGNGTYRFHSEAQDNVASNAGTFSASNGHWSLKASNGYTDGGTYSFQSPDTWIATGYQLGTGTWRRRS